MRWCWPCWGAASWPGGTGTAPPGAYSAPCVLLSLIHISLRANRTKNIVFVGNNVQARALAAALPGKNVLFAFALSAGHREVDRVVSIDLKKITIGQLPGTISNKQLIGRIFHGTKYKVVYEPNMEDYLLCHAAFVMPAAFACYKTDGDLKKLRGDTAYLNRVLNANIEGYRAILSLIHISAGGKTTGADISAAVQCNHFSITFVHHRVGFSNAVFHAERVKRKPHITAGLAAELAHHGQVALIGADHLSLIHI